VATGIFIGQSQPSVNHFLYISLLIFIKTTYSDSSFRDESGIVEEKLVLAGYAVPLLILRSVTVKLPAPQLRSFCDVDHIISAPIEIK
jgi:hypothetical protein